MPLGDFVEPGTVPKPLLIGRVARLAFAAFTLFVFTINLAGVRVFVSTDIGISNFLYFIAVFWAWWYFSDLVDVGFGKAWGRWPQIAFFPSGLVLAVIGLAAYSSAWEPLLGWGIFLFTEFFYGFIGLSFLLSAIFASPG